MRELVQDSKRMVDVVTEIKVGEKLLGDGAVKKNVMGTAE